VEPDRGTVEVRLGVLAPPVDLRADMTVTAEIEVSRRESVLAVPVGALVSGPDGGPAVWTAVDGVAVARPVVLGGRGSALVEILSGLNEGEIVLLAQTGEIEAGQRVRPRLRPPRP
jgi:multidrug efflux pump subunit AcrA (membrane-fusion protein)